MRKNKKKMEQMTVTILFFCCIIVVLLFSVKNAAKGNVERQKESLEKAIQRDIAYNYAVTGTYPKTLMALEMAYGLSYDKDLFAVEYEVRGSKVPPLVKVTQIGE